MIDRIAKLEAALRVNVALRVRAECLIAAYVASESDRGAIINELIALFEGPGQRESKRLAEAALDEARGGEAEAPAHVRRRLLAEVIMAVTTGLLCVVTLFWPDWIEVISGGFDPDQRGGSAEWIIAMAMLVVTLAMLVAFPWTRTARAQLNG
jgi:hypothetical protein